MLIKTLSLTALAALSLALTACGGSDPAPSTTAAATTAAPAAAAETTAAPAADVDTAINGTGMKGGCDGVRKIFLALDAGNQGAAEDLKDKAEAILDDVAATAATDIDTATDGANLSADLGFQLPTGPIYQSQLAKDYTSICVGKYKAAALPG